MLPKTRRILFSIVLINCVFFLYLIFIVWKEFDSFLFYKTALHTMTSIDADMFHANGMGIDSVPLMQFTVVGGIVKIVNLAGCSYVLFGDQKKPVLPMTWREVSILAALTLLANVCYTAVIRARFAATYCRGWMVLADDILLPVLFMVLTLYGWRQLRRGKKTPSKTRD